MAITTTKQREVIKFTPNVPVEVALKYAMPGKVISTRTGERVLFTLVDNRVMFLDLDVSRKVEDLCVNVREKFFVCKKTGDPTSENQADAEWTVWLSPETEKVRSGAEARRSQRPESPTEEETPLERQLRESIDAVNQVKWGEVGNGTFVVPNVVPNVTKAGASALTPAPVDADAQNGHHASDNGNGTTNGKNGNGNRSHKREEPMDPAPWAQSILGQTDALVDIYAAALNTASTRHGNQIKPEDVRSLLVTVFIQRSKVSAYGG